MPDLLIRNLPKEVNARLERLARAERRSKEKQAMVLIESALGMGGTDDSIELADRILSRPVPDVDPKEIDAFIASRGRRSRRE